MAEVAVLNRVRLVVLADELPRHPVRLDGEHQSLVTAHQLDPVLFLVLGHGLTQSAAYFRRH